ncbi:MAG: vanomycin resistance protein VanB [Chloroflexi bacterium AL-W]|nr:vanomycin resistance protein VanB [Chloroflexi bacterium AL-N1]NOK69274.1 vanomycin resistance protein VanB [Chloroflexi bacterium AL-N10]NOK76335.1 vanomycin resistance protein VanB [Chloroflexi bacterium AL-N5]NOK83452.1 vanomycin resistance protein VanB [Chloroflexi bacterium AL-W]NOK91112.1 vanomycin resistance protein VanB [Chloroflexi bacterium AL-N15]
MSADEFLRDYPAVRNSEDPYVTQPLQTQPDAGQVSDAPESSEATTVSQQPKRLQWSRASIVINTLLVVFTLIMVGDGGGLYYLDQTYQGVIYPNVTVQGVAVGDMSSEEAETALRQKYQPFLDQPVTFTFGDQTWQPTAEELGINFNFAGTIEKAYRSGRDNGLIANLQEVAAIWQNGLELPIQVSFDQNQMHAYVSDISATLEKAPADATVDIIGTTVTMQPAREGRQVLVDQTVQDLTDKLSTFTTHTVAIRTRDLSPRLSTEEAQAAQQTLKAMIQSPLTLMVNETEYVWSPKEIALMIDIARVLQNESVDQLDISLNSYHIDRRLREIVDDTGRGSVNPRVAWNGGNLQIIRAGESGFRVDQDASRQLIYDSIDTNKRVLALPVRSVAPEVSEANLNDLGIKELVAVGKSDFTGSEGYRITNIGVGMDMLNGILLAPGEEFSFNESIGSIDERNGFVQGYAIIQNRTQLEYGGGICQDSTTMFRAAFWAGLPITERHGHSFYINWYDRYALGPYGDGPGMDATIFLGGPDLKFLNDTGNWLLIQSYSNPTTGLAEVAMYGTKPNRQVELTQQVYGHVPAPTTPVYIPDAKQPRGVIKQTDTARGGMSIDVYRIITEDGVRQEPELFRTTFKPWANKFAINPADLGPDGFPARPEPADDPDAQEGEGEGDPAPPAEQAQPEAPAPPAEQAQPAPEQAQPAPEQAQPAPENG